MKQKCQQFCQILLKSFDQAIAIIYNNLLTNHRILLFWKEMCVILCIFLASIFPALVFKADHARVERTFLLFSYSIIAMVFISRSSVAMQLDNRKKFMYFQQAYGLSSFVYVITWILYSLLLGSLKMIFYLTLTYYFLLANNGYYSESFQGYNQQPIIIPYNFSQICVFNFQAYLSTHSLTLFLGLLIPYRQIGIKLITPLLLFGFLVLVTWDITLFNRETLAYYSPSGWFCFYLFFGTMELSYFFTDAENKKIFLMQFLIPLGAAIAIELAKVNRFRIFNFCKECLQKNRQRNHQSELKPVLLELSNAFGRRQLLRFENITKTYGKNNVLNNITGNIYEGETIILFGKNCSGKSILLKILNNIEFTSKGVITKHQQLKIGVLMQDNYFQDCLTVKQNLFFYAAIKGIFIGNKQAQLLEKYELNEFSNKEYYKISGGNKRKLSVACAFLGRNNIIFMDQPTLGIDVKSLRQIERIIIRQKKSNENMAIIISTCDENMVFLDLAERIWILEKGSLILNQLLKNIQGEETIQAVFSGLTKSQKSFMSQISTSKSCKLQQKQKNIIRLTFNIGSLYQVIKSFIGTTIQQKINLRKLSKKDIILSYLSTHEDSPLSQEQKVSLLNNIKQLLIKSKQNKNSILVFIAALGSNFYTYFPSILDFLFLFFLPIITFGYAYWFAIKGVKFNVIVSIFLYGWPTICNFNLIEFSSILIETKQTNQYTQLFTSGMKKIPFWLSIFALNSSIIILSILFGFLVLSSESISQYYPNILLTTLNLLSFYYLCSMFFKYSYICFGFLPVAITLLNHTINVFTTNLPQNSQSLNTLIQIVKYSNPSYLVSTTLTNLQIFYAFLWQLAIYLTIFFSIKQIAYWTQNRKKSMKAVQMIENQAEQAINQKLQVHSYIESNFMSIQQQPLIVLSNVFLKFSQKKMGIKGINMMINKGEIYGLLGLNGSGKSTTLKVIINQIFKDFGAVFFEGKQIKSESSSVYQQVGVSFQNFYLNPSITVENHLKIQCALKNIPFSLISKLVQSLLKLFNMQNCKKSYIGNLSKGIARKLTLISAFVGNNKYLLLDEPTLGIDAEGKETFELILQYFSKEFGSACLLVSHTLNQIQRCCDKIGYITQGTLAISSTPNRILQKYGKGYIFRVYSSNFNQLKAVFTPMLSRNFDIFQVTEKEEKKQISVLIPNRCFQLLKVSSIISTLQQQKLLQRFEFQKQGLIDIFDRLPKFQPTSKISEPI